MAESVTVKVNVDLSAVEAAEARVAALQNQALGIGGGGVLGGSVSGGVVSTMMKKPALANWTEHLKAINVVGSLSPRRNVGLPHGGAAILNQNFANQIDDIITHLYAPSSTIKPNLIGVPSLSEFGERGIQIIPSAGERNGTWIELGPRTPGFSGTSIPPQIAGINSFKTNLPPAAIRTSSSSPISPDDWDLTDKGGPNDGGLPPAFDPRRGRRGATTLFNGIGITPKEFAAQSKKIMGAIRSAGPIMKGLGVYLAVKPLQSFNQNFAKRVAESPSRSFRDLSLDAITDTAYQYSDTLNTLLASPLSLFMQASAGLGVLGQATIGLGEPREMRIMGSTVAQHFDRKQKLNTRKSYFQHRYQSIVWNMAFDDAVKEIPSRVEDELQSIHARLESTGFRVERFLVDREFKEQAERKVRERFAEEQGRLRPKYTQSEGIRSGGNR